MSLFHVSAALGESARIPGRSWDRQSPNDLPQGKGPLLLCHRLCVCPGGEYLWLSDQEWVDVEDISVEGGDRDHVRNAKAITLQASLVMPQLQPAWLLFASSALILFHIFLDPSLVSFLFNMLPTSPWASLPDLLLECSFLRPAPTPALAIRSRLTISQPRFLSF